MVVGYEDPQGEIIPLMDVTTPCVGSFKAPKKFQPNQIDNKGLFKPLPAHHQIHGRHKGKKEEVVT